MDFDGAVGRLAGEISAGRAPEVERLTRLCWELLGELPDERAAGALVRLERVLARGSSRHPYIRMHHGMALIQRYGASAVRADLDRGVAALFDALPRVPVGAAGRDTAVHHLVAGFTDQAGGTDITAALDAAVLAGEQELAVADDGLLDLSFTVAYSYLRRWSDAHDNDGDRDRSIELWGVVLEHVPGNTLAALSCGTLYLDRADRRRTAGDIGETLRLGELAVHGLQDGDPVTAECWNLLANAHYLRGSALHEVDGFGAAADCFTTALRHAPSDDLAARIARDHLRAVAELRDRNLASQEAFRAAVRTARATLDAAVAADGVNRARLAGTLALTELRSARRENRPFDVARVRALIAPYQGFAMPNPHWRAELDTAAALVSLLAGDAVARAEAMRVLDRELTAPRWGPETRTAFAERMPHAVLAQAVLSGDLRGFDAALELIRAQGGPDNRVTAALGDGWRQMVRGDTAVAMSTMEHAQRLMADATTGPPASIDDASDHVVRLAIEVYAAGARDDVPALRRAAATATALLPWFPPDHRLLRTAAYELAGTAELEVARRDRADRAAAARAAAHFAEACTLAGGPHHQRWPVLARCRGLSLRLTAHPDRAATRRLGRSALLAFTWQALLQHDDEAALDAARAAAETVRLVAGWCTADAAYENNAHHSTAVDDLVAVLDAGRGLVLHAVSTSRSMPDRLTDAGHPGLAARWRAAGHDGTPSLIPDDLREQALHALTAGADILNPVTVPHIREALAAVGSDALVYLVPADEWQQGMAVVVPVAGRVDILPLPDLRAGQVPDVSTHAPRDLTPVGAAPAPGLDEVARWAWAAAIGPLVEYTWKWGRTRPPRLVLVPVGDLGRVPWHAASSDGHRYAVEDLVLSSGVSARTFCAGAAHPLRAPESALVVGDPRDDLPYAAAEARAVQQSFYPRGTLLPRATVDDVLGWVSDGGHGPAVLHLACHGHLDPARPVDAYLALAGGDLPARRLLELSRSAGLDLDLVVLSACSTGVTGSVHDEALSMASAFLAGGAHTVFGALCRVPDADTSLLMYVLHHHLSTGVSPVDAVRAAQLWMLDQARTAPRGMPPDLAARCGAETLADPLSWGAFVHLGR